MSEIKIKPLTKNQIMISIDRLTRFKNTEIKYLRVFHDLLIHNLIYPKYSKIELENFDCTKLRDIATEIINYSLEQLSINIETDYSINKKIAEYEKSIFKFSKETEILLANKINYKGFIKLIANDDVKNLLWLKSLDCKDIIKERNEKSFKFPIELLLIAEGATEETLLPEFSKLCGLDFDKEGVYLLSAGGKNQVVKSYYELADTLRIPIFILLDSDGIESSREISPKLRPSDTIHLLRSGEFEDLLSMDLIKRTLEYEFKNISFMEDLFNDFHPRVKFLEEIFKNRGMHEFKKASFANSVRKNIRDKADISPEMLNIIEEIRKIKNKKVIVDN